MNIQKLAQLKLTPAQSRKRHGFLTDCGRLAAVSDSMTSMTTHLTSAVHRTLSPRVLVIQQPT